MWVILSIDCLVSIYSSLMNCFANFRKLFVRIYQVDVDAIICLHTCKGTSECNDAYWFLRHNTCSRWLTERGAWYNLLHTGRRSFILHNEKKDIFSIGIRYKEQTNLFKSRNDVTKSSLIGYNEALKKALIYLKTKQKLILMYIVFHLNL